MIIDFSEYLGQVKNDTGVWGRAFIFKVITDEGSQPYTFDCILFVHDTLPPFVSLTDEDVKYRDQVLEKILEKYTIKQLLEVI